MSHQCEKCKGTGFLFGKGWHESPDESGKAPEHRDAMLRAQAKNAMNSPMVRDAKITNIPISEINTQFEGDAPSLKDVNAIMEKIQRKEKIPPILVSPNKYLQDGRHRLAAYKKLGYKKVPAIIGYNVGIFEITKDGKPLELEVREYKGQKYKTPKKRGDKTKKFKQALSRHLSQLARKNPDDTTIPEFRRWMKEDVSGKNTLDEQIDEKIYYEKDIGNDNEVFKNTVNFLNNWVKENIEEKEKHIWYHGTTEEKYRKIMADGEIKVSTAGSAQHKDFTHDIGTISLAKHKGMAHFFSALSGRGKKNQIILHIDTNMLDPSAMEKRALLAPEAEILYHKNITASAIIRAETVYVAKKQGELR